MLPNKRSPEPLRQITVDPEKEVVAGRNYPTFALADAYTEAQTPSNTKRFCTSIGDNSENITIKAFTLIKGNMSDLTGAIDSNGAFDPTNPWKFLVKNCIINDLALSGSNALVIRTCMLKGGTPPGGSVLITSDGCLYVGGDYSNIASHTILDDVLYGGTFGSGINMYDTLSANVGNAINFNGGFFSNCVIGHGTFNAGTYNIVGGCLSVNVTLNSGDNMTLNGTTLDGVITVNTGGSLFLRNHVLGSGGSIVDGGGTIVYLTDHKNAHKNGGSDEIATTTPGAFEIPKADGSALLDSWISDATTSVKGKVELATDGESAANVVVQGNDSRLSDARTPTAHTIASHSDTTATGAELETLTDTSDANALHKHNDHIRRVSYDEDRALDTTTLTGANWATKISKAVVPTGTQKFKIRADWQVGGNTDTMVTGVRFRDTTGGTNYKVQNFYCHGTSDNWGNGSCELEVDLSASTTFEIQFQSDNVANTARLHNSQISVDRVVE